MQMFSWCCCELCFQGRSKWYLWFNRGNFLKEDRKLPRCLSKEGDSVGDLLLEVDAGWFWPAFFCFHR